MNSKTQSTNYKHCIQQEHEREVAQVLAPCFTDPPTAGAIVVVTDDAGTAYYSINLPEVEAAELLLQALAKITRLSNAAVLPPSGVLQ